MRCCRLVSGLTVALLAAGLWTVASGGPVHADEEAPASESSEEDDGPSAGDVLGLLSDPEMVGAIAQATPGAAASIAADGVGDVAESAASGIAGSMAQGAVALLEEFAGWWTSWTVIDLRDAGIDSPLGLALGLAMLVAWLLLVVEAGRAAYSGDGTAIGNALVGLLKVTLVVAVLVPFVQALLYAADELTLWIVDSSFGDMDGLEAKLTSLFTFDPIVGIGLMFVFGLVGIVLVLLLMFEFVLRHAGILIMLCAAPIAAVGMVARPTAAWWPKAARGLLTLIMLKPVVAFIFAIAFGILGDSEGVKSLVVGMAALVAAAVAWPVVASYFTFTSIGGGGSVGAAIAGGAAGWLGGRAAGGGTPSGAAARGGSSHSLAVEREADADQAGSHAQGAASTSATRTAAASTGTATRSAGTAAGRTGSATGSAMGGAGAAAGSTGTEAGSTGMAAESMGAAAGPAGTSTGSASAGRGAGGRTGTSTRGSTSGRSAGVTGALSAATASVNATRAGIEQTSAGLTDMARHADLATPYPAAGGAPPAGGVRRGASRHGRHRRHRADQRDDLDLPTSTAGRPEPPAPPEPPA